MGQCSRNFTTFKKFDDDISGGAHRGATGSNIFGQSERSPPYGNGGLIQSQTFREPSSLFVPEEGDPEPTQMPLSNVSIGMPPPARPLIVRSHATAESQSPASACQSATPLHSTATTSRSTATPSRSVRSLISLVQSAQNQFSRRSASNEQTSRHTSRNPAPSTRDPVGDQEENANKKAIEDFERRERYYEDIKNRNGGKLSFKQEVEWFKICNEEETRREKRKRDRLLDQKAAGELFPEIGYETRASNEPEGDEDTGNSFEFNAPDSPNVA